MATTKKKASVTAKKKTADSETENPDTIRTVAACEIHVGNVSHILPKDYVFNLSEDGTRYEAKETADIYLPLLSEMEEEQRELFI